jgi:chromosome segregation ATPase
MLKSQKEIDRLEHAYNEHFNTLWNMLSSAKFSLTKRFFETIATRVKHVYDIANRDADSWLRSVMSPLESQVREHHAQLRRRVDSIRRIQGASGELEARVGELEAALAAIDTQVAELERDVTAVDAIVLQPEALPRARVAGRARAPGHRCHCLVRPAPSSAPRT